MISFVLRRIALGLATAAVLATCAAIVVAALAFALYALVRPQLGQAGAAAVVAASAAGLIFVVGVALALAGRQSTRATMPQDKDPVARVLNFLKEKPVTAFAAAVGAGFMAVRNPRYLGAAISSFLDGPETRRRKR